MSIASAIKWQICISKISFSQAFVSLYYTLLKYIYARDRTAILPRTCPKTKMHQLTRGDTFNWSEHFCLWPSVESDYLPSFGELAQLLASRRNCTQSSSRAIMQQMRSDKKKIDLNTGKDDVLPRNELLRIVGNGGYTSAMIFLY